jgi:hypothetical protein
MNKAIILDRCFELHKPIVTENILIIHIFGLTKCPKVQCISINTYVHNDSAGTANQCANILVMFLNVQFILCTIQN